MPYSVVTDDAFILSARPYRENDRLVECFMREHGKVRVRARSVRREASQLRSSVLPYRYSRVTLVVAMNNTLKDIRTVDSLDAVWSMPARQRAYTGVLSFLSRYLPEDEPYPSVFSDVLEVTRGLSEACTDGECVLWETACTVHAGIALGYIPKHDSDSLADTVRQMKESEKVRRDFSLMLESLRTTSHL